MNVTEQTIELIQFAVTGLAVVFVAMAVSNIIARLIERAFWE